MKTILFCGINIEVNDQAEFVTLDRYGNIHQWDYEPRTFNHGVWKLEIKPGMVLPASRFVKKIDPPTKRYEMKKSKVKDCMAVITDKSLGETLEIQKIGRAIRPTRNPKIIEMVLIDLYGQSENCQDNLRVSIQPDGGAISDLSNLSDSERDIIEGVFKQMLKKAFYALWNKEPEITLIYQKQDS